MAAWSHHGLFERLAEAVIPSVDMSAGAPGALDTPRRGQYPRVGFVAFSLRSEGGFLDQYTGKDRFNMLIIWAVIVVVVLISALLIYMEYEWGFALGGSTAVILVISYCSTDLILRSPLARLLPQSSTSQFDVMAITAVVLIGLALIAIAYFLGRRSGSKKK